MITFIRLERSPFAFPLACLAALAMVFISETFYWQSANTLDSLGNMANARSNIQGLLRHIVDAETGQRGYLLTDRKEYLKPYSAALDEIHESLHFLDKYYEPEPKMRSTLDQLRSITERKLSEMDTTIRLKDENKADAWKSITLSDIGREQMETIRQISETLLEHESEKVAAGRKDVYDTLMLNRIGVASMSAVSLLALFMYLRQTAALDAQRKEQQRIVQAERDGLELEVRNRTQQLTELAHHLQTAREDERSRLARDLHDELGALLTAAKLDAARLKSRLGAAMTPEAAERLAHLNETLNSGIALKRRIIEDLRPSSLSNLGLIAALEIQAREFAERTDIAVDCQLEEVRLKPAGDLMVYRLVQEALTNVAKYAAATRVTITLGMRDGLAEISVRDNGVGFDTSVPRAAAHGLVGMRYRVQAEGGEMTLDSSRGQGTLIVARLPALPADPPPDAETEATDEPSAQDGASDSSTAQPAKAA